MNSSILKGKAILAVDDEPDILHILEEEILDTCPDCVLTKATTYDIAAPLLETESYDIVILDIMGVRGFDLLEIAVKRGFKVAMLTANSFSPEALKRSKEMGARAYLPKEKLGEIAPFLENILKHDHESGWKHLLENLKELFDEKFEADWEKRIGFP